MEMIRKAFRFTGIVQFVGFRYTARHLARNLGVTGWVKNERDGSVSMEAQGSKEQLEQLLKGLDGGRYIRIDHIEERDLPIQEENDFHVKQ